MIVGRNGLTSLRFTDRMSNELVEAPVTKHPDFIGMLQDDVGHLIRAYQEYFMHLAHVAAVG